MSAIKIETTIKGGLPVIAEGRYVHGYRGGYYQPSEPACIEDIDVQFLSGHTYTGDLSAADLERIAGKMIDARHGEQYEWRER